MKPTQISQTGINLIKSFEGCALHSYRDQGGVWTVGYGHTSNVKPDQVITRNQAEKFLVEDLDFVENVVYKQITVSLTQNQFDALCSFTFNEGGGHLAESTLKAKLNARDYAGAADAILLWNKVRGCVVPGLVRRRFAERALFVGVSLPSAARVPGP